jgi:hypothetical protein
MKKYNPKKLKIFSKEGEGTKELFKEEFLYIGLLSEWGTKVDLRVSFPQHKSSCSSYNEKTKHEFLYQQRKLKLENFDLQELQEKQGKINRKSNAYFTKIHHNS